MIGADLRPDVRRECERDTVAARAALGADAFEKAYVQGGSMTLEQGIEYALAFARPEAPTGPPPRTKRRDSDPLAAREREVAVLVAQGLSNRDIAARLVISERTAETHVQHILNKLGFGSRAQIAA
jgi:non-specific serine/threonine protein kinase